MRNIYKAANLRVAPKPVVKTYRPGVTDMQAVLSRGLGTKVNAPQKVSFEVKV